ncbi:MAG: hypothetical protein ACI8PZ_002851 [Myxococcota bacterium]|jgi:hypothetical protein
MQPRRRVRPLARVTVASAVMWLPLLVLGLFPSGVEAIYVPWIGYPASLVLTSVSGLFPLCAAEWVEVGAGLVAVLWIGSLVRSGWTGSRNWREVAATAAWGVAAAGTGLGLLFHLTWGLHYGRPTAAAQLGWAEVELTADDGSELTQLAERLVQITNTRYVAVHGATDAGVVSATLPPPSIDAATDRGWERAVGALGLPARVARSRGPAKPLLSSPVFTRLGISGFYFPFTGEANYNTMPPRWQLPHTIAHEKAHQRGIAREDEANFFGFVACVHSDTAFVEYAGFLFAQRQILRVLLQIDPEAAIPLIEDRHPGVQRDVDAAHLFWTGYDGAARDFGHAMNDAYLRLNRVEGGTLSYSRAAQLIVAWAREGGLAGL